MWSPDLLANLEDYLRFERGKGEQMQKFRQLAVVNRDIS